MKFRLVAVNSLFTAQTNCWAYSQKYIRDIFIRPATSRSLAIPRNYVRCSRRKRDLSLSLTPRRKTVIRVHRWLTGKVWPSRIVTAQILSFKRNLFGSIGSYSPSLGKEIEFVFSKRLKQNLCNLLARFVSHVVQIQLADESSSRLEPTTNSFQQTKFVTDIAVSYTHLTLPTICSV